MSNLKDQATEVQTSLTQPKYTKHVFVCTNDKEGGKKHCGSVHGMRLVDALKEDLKNRGLQTTIRAQKTGCLNMCAFGPALVVYPEGVFYGNVQLEDVAEIVESHLVGNKPVERLAI
jgi:(2Fe-2S) ferredoxin